MWSLKLIYKRNKGFTLLELILAIGLSSIVALSLLSILNYSKNTSIIGNEIDELMLNGRYAMEYIKKEIKAADKILPANKIYVLRTSYKNNLGFAIMNKEGQSYRYTSYYWRNDGKLFRISGHAAKEQYPVMDVQWGHNEIGEFFHSIKDSKFDLDNNMIYLDLKLKSTNGQELNLKTNIFIRCPIDN